MYLIMFYQYLALESQDYLVAGRIMAYSLVHGSQVPCFLAPELITYLVDGLKGHWRPSQMVFVLTSLG
jgi:hypothetical protein